jgi:cell division protein FtsB
MKVDLGIWEKLTRVVIFLLLVALLFVVVVWYMPLINHNERLRKQILKLDAQIQQEEETSRSLKASYDAVHRDPKTIERLARERLGYAKAGETIIRFEEPTTNGPSLR